MSNAKQNLPLDKMYIDSLPSVNMHERSFMHRSLVADISVAKFGRFAASGHFDGRVKFWKKTFDHIEFVKYPQNINT